MAEKYIRYAHLFFGEVGGIKNSRERVWYPFSAICILFQQAITAEAGARGVLFFNHFVGAAVAAVYDGIAGDPIAEKILHQIVGTTGQT